MADPREAGREAGTGRMGDEVILAAARTSGTFLEQLLELKRLGAPVEELQHYWDEYFKVLRKIVGVDREPEEPTQQNG